LAVEDAVSGRIWRKGMGIFMQKSETGIGRNNMFDWNALKYL